MYVASVCFLGAQFMADSYGITLVNFEGVPIRSSILDFIHTDKLNAASTELIPQPTGNANKTTFILDPVLAGATFAWEIFQLFTGVYIFNLIYLFGVPAIYITAITIPYMILLFLFVIAKIRGV